MNKYNGRNMNECCARHYSLMLKNQYCSFSLGKSPLLTSVM